MFRLSVTKELRERYYRRDPGLGERERAGMSLILRRRESIPLGDYVVDLGLGYQCRFVEEVRPASGSLCPGVSLEAESVLGDVVFRLEVTGEKLDGYYRWDEGLSLRDRWAMDLLLFQNGELEEGVYEVDLSLSQPSLRVGEVVPPVSEAENLELRRMLAFAYCRGLYTDDGELQDSTDRPFIDFLRDSPGEIREKMRARAVRAIQAGEAIDFLGGCGERVPGAILGRRLVDMSSVLHAFGWEVRLVRDGERRFEVECVGRSKRVLVEVEDGVIVSAEVG